jgi:HK97 family phage portal protein
VKLFGREWTFKKNANTENFLEMTLDEEAEETSLCLFAYAQYIIIDLISSIVSNIEFKTYGNNAEEKKSVIWTKLNVHPNRNQNSTEFIKELVSKLLLGEVLIVEVNEQYIIADTFEIEERAILGNVFTNVTRGNKQFRDRFHSKDVIYLKYSNKAVQMYMRAIVEMYERLIGVAADKYARSSEEKGILMIDQQERNRKDFNEIYEEIINKRFKKFFSRGNHVLPLFNGYNYTSNTSESTKKYSNEVTDVKTLFEDAIARVAQAYKVPVGLVRGDVAGIKEAYTMLLTNCIDPIAHMIGEEFTYKVYSEEEIINGYAIEADTTNLKHIDIFDLASNIDKLIASGFLSIDEVREKAGLRGLDEEWSRVHYMTLNYTTAQAAVDAGKALGDEQAESEKEGSEEET